MKYIRNTGYAILAVVIATAVAGCNNEEKADGAAAKDAAKMAEGHAEMEHPATEEAASEKPKDHPAH